jgi:hypothetical protein
MSGEFKPKLCKECYEERDLKPTWPHRIEAGIALLGVCDVCLVYEACIEVTAQEALQLTRSDKKIIKAVVIGVGVAVFIWLAFFVGTLRYRACRAAGVSVLNCVTQNFFRWREQTMKNKGLDVQEGHGEEDSRSRHPRSVQRTRQGRGRPWVSGI